MINFNYEDTPWRFDLEEETRDWLGLVVRHHEFDVHEVNYVLCSDDYLLYLNKKYLGHDEFTDILTFDYTHDGTNSLTADIFISVDRVRDNATQFGSAFVDELHRVMVHGVLHLTGHDDSTEELKRAMRQMEDFALNLRMF